MATFKSASNKAVDQNNNTGNIGNNNNNTNNNKLKYELPADYKYEILKCICDRPQKAFECNNCHHYFHGRLTEFCKVHPTDFFLMDFRQCPYCSAPTTDIKVSKLSWAEIRKIEEANFDDNDDF